MVRRHNERVVFGVLNNDVNEVAKHGQESGVLDI